MFDPYKEEREEYDRKLEEYAKIVRTKDHFVVRQIEKTHFEVSVDMGEVHDPVEGTYSVLVQEPFFFTYRNPVILYSDYQMTPLEPFVVSVPSSMKTFSTLKKQTFPRVFGGSRQKWNLAVSFVYSDRCSLDTKQTHTFIAV